LYNSPLGDLRKSVDEIISYQNLALSKMTKLIAQNHPHYSNKYSKLGINLANVSTLSDLESLPVTEKMELVSNPENFKLKPDRNALSEYIIWDIVYTAGTSSSPTPIYQTSYDFRGILLAQIRMAEIRGMSNKSRIMNLYPITTHPHGAWLRANNAASALGCSITAGMSGRDFGSFELTRKTSEIVDLTIHANPTVLWGVPSYIREVLSQISRRGQKLPDLDMIAVSGEPCTMAMRKSLTELAASLSDTEVVVSDSLGASELQCGLVECALGTGFHNPAPELFLLEALDQNGKRVSENEIGSLAITHLDRRGTVLLRYLLGDKVQITYQNCDNCGRGGGRIVAHKGREGRFTKIRGNLVNLDELLKILIVDESILEYQIEIHKQSKTDPLSLDELTVRVVPGPTCKTTEIGKRILAAIRINPIVEVVTRDQIWGNNSSLKATRIIDSRDFS
jgi:phenylacetate-coenzyme A ligase PaaK-like adenylate-forming protein